MTSLFNRLRRKNIRKPETASQSKPKFTTGIYGGNGNANRDEPKADDTTPGTMSAGIGGSYQPPP